MLHSYLAIVWGGHLSHRRHITSRQPIGARPGEEEEEEEEEEWREQWKKKKKHAFINIAAAKLVKGNTERAAHIFHHVIGTADRMPQPDMPTLLPEQTMMQGRLHYSCAASFEGKAEPATAPAFQVLATRRLHPERERHEQRLIVVIFRTASIENAHQ